MAEEGLVGMMSMLRYRSTKTGWRTGFSRRIHSPVIIQTSSLRKKQPSVVSSRCFECENPISQISDSASSKPYGA